MDILQINMLAAGIGSIFLGLKGFSQAGIPWTSSKRITGSAARVVGWICISVGALLILGIPCLMFIKQSMVTLK